jgi:hypothetical protein
MFLGFEGSIFSCHFMIIFGFSEDIAMCPALFVLVNHLNICSKNCHIPPFHHSTIAAWQYGNSQTKRQPRLAKM